MESTESSTGKLTGYYPWWLDNLSDDVTGEGAAIEGTLHGAEEVRKLELDARELYEQHEFHKVLPPALSLRLLTTQTGRPSTL